MSAFFPSILHLSQRPFWCGESNRVLVLCRGLHERGYPLLLGAPEDSALTERAIAEGLPVEKRFKFTRGFRPGSLLHDIRLLRRLHRQKDFHVVHTHTSEDTWTAAMAFGSREARTKPKIIRTRHSDHGIKNDFMHDWLYRKAIDHAVLSSASLSRPLSGMIGRGALTPGRMTVIHSSVDVDRFDPARVSGNPVRQELGLEGRLCIGLIGRLSGEKGHELLLSALPALIKEEPRVCAVFAGEGEEEQRLRGIAESGSLQEHVRFAGFRSDIPRVMAAMDIIVVPSLSVESSPGVVKEGMAMSKPVIAADVGGVSEIIRHGEDGWIIERNNADALQGALLRLIKDPAARGKLASASRASVAARFTDEHLIENTIKLYLKLTENL